MISNKNNSKTKLYFLIANTILQTHSIITLRETDEIRIYQNGTYSNKVPNLKELIQEFYNTLDLDKKLRIVDYHNIIEIIKTKTYVSNREIHNKDYLINCKNGYYDFNRGKFLEHNGIPQIQINAYYDEKANQCKIFVPDVINLATRRMPTRYRQNHHSFRW